jgi:hypothetical protein
MASHANHQSHIILLCDGSVDESRKGSPQGNKNRRQRFCHDHSQRLFVDRPNSLFERPCQVLEQYKNLIGSIFKPQLPGLSVQLAFQASLTSPSLISPPPLPSPPPPLHLHNNRSYWTWGGLHHLGQLVDLCIYITLHPFSTITIIIKTSSVSLISLVPHHHPLPLPP